MNLDPDYWELDPQDDDVPDRKITYKGVVGSPMEGAVLVVRFDEEDE